MACFFPYFTKLYGPVPCGKCPDCRKRRVNGWSFRLSWEDRRSSNCEFICLTYDNDHLTYSLNGYANLCTRHLQLFFKSLRKSLSTKYRKAGSPPPRIRYLACGEYGGRFARPHYHVILFNLPKADLALVYQSWPHGNVDIDLRPVAGGAFAYVAGYSLAGRDTRRAKTDDRVRPKIYVSQGIGGNYVDANSRYHIDDFIPYVTTSGGIRLSLPRYLRDKIFYCPVLLKCYSLYLESLPEPLSRTAMFAAYLKQYGGNHYFAFEAYTEARRTYTRNFFRLHTKTRDL